MTLPYSHPTLKIGDIVSPIEHPVQLRPRLRRGGGPVWVLARTRPSVIERAEFALMRAGFEAWIPRERSRMKIGGKRRTVRQPIPGGYIFIHGGPDDVALLESLTLESGAKAISQIVRNGDICTISPPAMMALRRRFDLDQGKPFKSGDLAAAVHGFWAGKVLEVDFLDDEDRAHCVAVPMLGRDVTPVLPIEVLEMASAKNDGGET